MSENYHVVPSEDGWDVKREKGKRASKHFETKKEAEKYSNELAGKQKVESIIHKQDGKIQKRNSYGNDPYPPKG
ncbi:MAG: DUF2188 domain-containing protein [Methanobacteriaceae archaeon]|nr:DUF2188 domain-containing protein [Methanobacteriaceae archaeon]